jgi:hypothetical protein
MVQDQLASQHPDLKPLLLLHVGRTKAPQVGLPTFFALYLPACFACFACLPADMLSQNDTCPQGGLLCSSPGQPAQQEKPS